MSVAIKIENLSKQYRLGVLGTGTISHDLNRFLAKLRGKEDPYLKVGDTNDRTIKGDSNLVWALKDINLEVQQGEILGIIGRNGAGKSTLLKILSQVTGPTTGSIKAKGRIASLLEVGTGFHPELTGRENIFLNGAILGMNKQEIRLKLEEIVAFAGIEKYIDTPVKRYSSGMMVRLGFAVAAHLEPEILVVDEVLAVGDAEFQKKAIGKMQDVSANQGRTVLFVSHNIQAVSNLCDKGLLLENGQVKLHGNLEECIKEYMKSSMKRSLSEVSLGNRLKRTSGKVLFTDAFLRKDGKKNWDFNYKDDISFYFEVKVMEEVESLLFYLAIKNSFSGEVITNYKVVISSTKLEVNKVLKIEVILPGGVLKPNQYGLYFALGNKDAKEFFDVLDNNVNLPVLNINPISMDVHENTGFMTAPFEIRIE